jgi:glycosyltransferase involved in cell wall biosynthesis
MPSEKIRILYEADSPQFRKIETEPVDERCVLYVGGISPNKNLSTLIRAFARLRARQAGVKLLLVGDYKSDGFKGCYAELNELTGSLNLKDEVIFAGYVPDEQLCLLYNRASLFVLPSLDEGFGLPAVEAMACGVPVVVSSGNSLSEVVGNAGVVIDPKDEAALASAMDQILGDSQLSARLSERSLERASYFSWDSAAQNLLQIFEDTRKSCER